ncbi:MULTISPECIES: hypothetical protein [Acidobacteriaceae]|uniref:hypothetical protein n=1 Tax=Acidobacteriaceae TaxID=204434 RepID=UPI00131CD3A8|nr:MULTISPECIES: hypothetical protein [Acidobacteriaceae]MDW5264129.1 hypothetical protein [Edaphobacter sp.]
MSAPRCCGVAATDAGRETPAAKYAGNHVRSSLFVRRCRSTVEWIIPAAILALLPKCPLCLAAYLVLATGVGLSMSAAIYLRTTIVTLCVASLLYMTARSIQRARQLKLATGK